MSKLKSCLPLAIAAAVSIPLIPQAAQAAPTLTVGGTNIPLTAGSGGTFTFSGSQPVTIGGQSGTVTSATVTATTGTTRTGRSLTFKLSNFTLQAAGNINFGGTAITFSNLFSDVSLTGPVTIAQQLIGQSTSTTTRLILQLPTVVNTTTTGPVNATITGLQPITLEPTAPGSNFTSQTLNGSTGSLSSPTVTTNITGLVLNAGQSVRLPSSACTVITEDHEGTFGGEDLAAACRASVPEPSTAFSVLGLGAMGVFAWARRRRQAEAKIA